MQVITFKKLMKLDRNKSLEAQLSIVVGFGLIAYFTKNQYLSLGVLLLGLVFLLSPTIGDTVSKVWFKIAELIGGVMSKVLLSIVFFIFLLPVATISKVFKKDILGLKKPEKSNYVERNHLYSGKDLEQIW